MIWPPIVQLYLETLHKLAYIMGLNVKKGQNNLVVSTFWWHSDFLLYIVNCYNAIWSICFRLSLVRKETQHQMI